MAIPSERESNAAALTQLADPVCRAQANGYRDAVAAIKVGKAFPPKPTRKQLNRVGVHFSAYLQGWAQAVRERREDDARW